MVEDGKTKFFHNHDFLLFVLNVSEPIFLSDQSFHKQVPAMLIENTLMSVVPACLIFIFQVSLSIFLDASVMKLVVHV